MRLSDVEKLRLLHGQCAEIAALAGDLLGRDVVEVDLEQFLHRRRGAVAQPLAVALFDENRWPLTAVTSLMPEPSVKRYAN